MILALTRSASPMPHILGFCSVQDQNMSTFHGQAHIQCTGKFTCSWWGLSKGVDAGRGKELGPIIKQNINEETSTRATCIDIVALQHFSGK